MTQGYTATQIEEGARTTERERFWAKVEQGEGRLAKWGCWTWGGQTGQAHVLKYGRFKRGGKWVRAHRMMWVLVNGPIPEGMFVLHKCDNPLCVKPAHLYVGTAADNTWDMLSRGRAGGTLPPHGKLTEQDVIEIRRIWTERQFRGYRHTLTMAQLGTAYGVSGPMISYIIHGKWWKAA